MAKKTKDDTLLKKRCPFCGKIYTSEIQEICSFKHCPNCGSTSVRTHRDIDWESFGMYVLIIVFISLFPLAVGSVFLALFTFLLLTSVVLVLKYQLYCRDCGKTFLFPKKNIPLIIEEERASKKKCSKCGAEMPWNAVFCGKCGSKL